MKKTHNIINITAIDVKEPKFNNFLNNFDQEIDILPIDENDFWDKNKDKPLLI